MWCVRVCECVWESEWLACIAVLAACSRYRCRLASHASLCLPCLLAHSPAGCWLCRLQRDRVLRHNLRESRRGADGRKQGLTLSHRTLNIARLAWQHEPTDKRPTAVRSPYPLPPSRQAALISSLPWLMQLDRTPARAPTPHVVPPNQPPTVMYQLPLHTP